MRSIARAHAACVRAGVIQRAGSRTSATGSSVKVASSAAITPNAAIQPKRTRLSRPLLWKETKPAAVVSAV